MPKVALGEISTIAHALDNGRGGSDRPGFVIVKTFKNIYDELSLLAKQQSTIIRNGELQIFEPVTQFGTDIQSVDLAANSSGGTNRAARSDHHHHLDEDVAPTWTSPHRWSVPSAEVNPAVGVVNVTGTIPLPPTPWTTASTPLGVFFDLTTPAISSAPTGSSAGINGVACILRAGYTGVGGTFAFGGQNQVAGTGTNVWFSESAGGGTFKSANYGTWGRANATTDGHNVGCFGDAFGGLRNHAVIGSAFQPKATAGALRPTNIAVAGLAKNESNERAIAGYFGLYGPTTVQGSFTPPDFNATTFPIAALVVDNGPESDNVAIAKFCMNGEVVTTIARSGVIGINASATGVPTTHVPLFIQRNDSTTADLIEMTQANGTTILAAFDPNARLRMLETSTPSSATANSGSTYTKDFSTRTELCYYDSSGVEVQLTSGGAVKMSLGNPSNPGVNLTGSNGTATTAMRSDAVLVLSQAIAPTWTAAHRWTPSAASSIPIRVDAHASQSVDMMMTVAPDTSDNVAINNDGILRLRDVSGLTGTYPGQAAPYGGLQDYGSGFSYCILYGMFDASGSNLTELWFDNENNTPQKLTVNGRLNLDTTIDWVWQAQQTFTQGIIAQAGSGPAGIEVDSIRGNSGSSDITIKNSISVDGINFKTGSVTGSKFGETGHKIGFLGATPILQQTGAGITGGFTAGAGAAVDSLSTWTGSGGVSGNTYTIGDIVDALKKFGFLS